MGKPSSLCIQTQLTMDYAASSSGQSSNSSSQGDDRLPPIPKLVISRVANSNEGLSAALVLQKPKKQPQQHNSQLVNRIIRGLSIPSGSGANGTTVTVPRENDPLGYATKIFRKRSSAQVLGFEYCPKIQVIDNAGSVPGALPTPIVRGSSSSSVFKSDACDTALRKYVAPKPPPPPATPPRPSSPVTPAPSLSGPLVEAKKESMSPGGSSARASSSPGCSPSTSTSSYQGRTSLIHSRPKVKTPPIDDFFRRPRTVAEKRLFLLQSPIEYRVMDFENSVYHLIKKLDRFNEDDTFRTQVELLMHGNVPTNRNIWRAVLWLNSECSKYTPWYVNVAERRIRLVGATGVMPLDEGLGEVLSWMPRDEERLYFLSEQNKQPLCCQLELMKPLKNEEEILEQLAAVARGDIKSQSGGSALFSPRSLMGKRSATVANLKPGPLSVKVRRMRAVEMDKELGPLEVYELPVKTITAVPQVNKPLPRKVTSYLKLAVPDESMTHEWLNYALSVLQPSDDVAEQEVPKFQFPIPYKNDQRRILVRRRVFNGKEKGEMRMEDYEEQMKYELTFPEVARRGMETTEGDEDTVKEVEGILTEMIDAVAMGFSEDSFIQEDPDLVYQKEDKPLPRQPKSVVGKVNDTTNRGVSSKGRSLLKSELRKLDVTIIDTAKFAQNDACTKEECVHGCVCESISRLSGLVRHCTKAECIFDCSCSPEDFHTDEQEHLKRMRDDNLRCLAPQEKDFRSTVVLTNSNTILMSNSEDRKRNRQRPKRFFDYLSVDVGEQTGEEQQLEEAGGPGEEQTRRGRKRKERPSDVHQDLGDMKELGRWPLELERLRHCAVVIPQVKQLDLLEPWCMVHELYRCFCGNQKVDGEPFKLHFAADGSIRANAKELTLMGNRRRQLPVAKDEEQPTLERIKRRLERGSAQEMQEAERVNCSRCMPTDFTEQFIKNRLNAELVNTKANLSVSRVKQQRLKLLVENCLNFGEVEQPARRRNSSSRPQQAADTSLERRQEKRDKFLEHVSNELGLKITSVCSLDTNEGNEYEIRDGSVQSASAIMDTVVNQEAEGKQLRPVPELSFEARLANLKRRLLAKLNSILMSTTETFIEPAYTRRVSFLRYQNFKMLLQKLTMYEVWQEKGGDCMVLVRSEKSALKTFPECQLVPITSERRKFYLSKFIADAFSRTQSNNIYIVLEGSGSDFWYVRGCQYIKDMQTKIRIQPVHTFRLKKYADETCSRPSNLMVYQMTNKNDDRLNVKLPVVQGSRYLMIDLQNDFSDIGHPRWKGLLSCKHMKQALDIAKLEDKTIQVIQGPSNMRPNVYATPGDDQRLFIGPYDMDEPCQLLLYQRVDSSLYLREEFEQMLNLKRELRTSGFWLTKAQLNSDAATTAAAQGAAVSPPAARNSSASAVYDAPQVQASSAISDQVEENGEEQVEEEEEQELENAPVLLPELEIVKVKTERQSTDTEAPPDHVVTISSASKNAQRTSLLKPFVERNTTQNTEEVQREEEEKKRGMTVSLANVKDMLRNTNVSTFRVGDTIVKRSSSTSTSRLSREEERPDVVIERVTEGQEEEDKEKEKEEDDDDDVVLLEEPDGENIIDLDEWEQDLEDSDEQAEGEQEEQKVQEDEEEEIPKVKEEVEDEVEEKAEEEKVETSRSSDKFDQSIPFRGFYKSNIPGLGHIPAKIHEGVITLSLPIRKMPIKIGVECVDRYMWNYLQNSVSACFPKDMRVKWEFVNTYFPHQDTMFKLEPDKHRATCILTPFGVLDVLKDIKTDKDIPDPAVYLKYLASRLCVMVFGRLDFYTADEIIEQALKVIKQERYQILKNNRELTVLKMGRVELRSKLQKLQETVPGPSWAGK